MFIVPINAIKSPEIDVTHISVFTLFYLLIYILPSLFNKRLKTMVLSFLQFNLPVCDLFFILCLLYFKCSADSSLPIKKHTFLLNETFFKMPHTKDIYLFVCLFIVSLFVYAVHIDLKLFF